MSWNGWEFTRFIVMPSGEVVQRGGLRLMTQALVSLADGPLGDSALAVDERDSPPS